MAERLLVVEDAFTANGPGVLVMPRFTTASPRRGTFAVKLVLPGGGAREVKASIDVAHMRGSLPPFAMYRLFEVTPGEVPAGTEIWSVD